MNSYIVHRVSKTFPRSITPALDLHPKAKPPTPLKTPPMTPSKFFPKSGHVRPEYLKRLDTIDGRIPYKYEPIYQPKMNRSSSARRIRFSDKSNYVFPRRDFNDNYIEGGVLKYDWKCFLVPSKIFVRQGVSSCILILPFKNYTVKSIYIYKYLSNISFFFTRKTIYVCVFWIFLIFIRNISLCSAYFQNAALGKKNWE